MLASKTKKINIIIGVFLFLFFLITPTISLAAEFWFVIQTDAAYSDGYTTESECNSKRISKAHNLVAYGKGDSLLTECFKYSKNKAFIVKSDYPEFLVDHSTKKASEILAEAGENNWWFVYKYTKDTEYRKSGDHVVAGSYENKPACEDVWQKQDKTNIVLVEACMESNTKPTTPTNSNTETADTDTTYTLLAPLPWLEGTIDTKKSDSNPCPFGNYLNILIKIFLGVCAVLAMVMIVIGGIEYMTSDLASSKEAGKKTITMAILGLLLALGAYLILKTINPELLDVCLNNLPKAEITISSAKEYRLAQTQAIDKSTGFVKTSYYDQIKNISAQVGIPNCLMQVAIQRESHGASLIGHDEDVPSPYVKSRRDFLASGKKFNGTTFSTGDKNDPRIKQSGFTNTDHPSDYHKAPNPNVSDLGLDWRFSHSVGMFGVTFGPNHLNPSGAQTLYSNPETDIQQSAIKMRDDYYSKCNNNIEGTWRAYNSGKCDGHNPFTNAETEVRMSLYNQCVAQYH